MKKKQLAFVIALLQITYSQAQSLFLCNKRICACIIISIFSFVSVSAQSRIAVVNGTTGALKVYSTLDSALKFALNGDYVYLPGGTFPADTITKKLYIFGAGISPDSTNATGRTVLIGDMYITNTASGGQLEGCVITNQVIFGTTAINQVVQNYTIKRCHIISQLTMGQAINPNSKNNFILENILGNVFGYSSINNVFIKNIIEHDVYNASYSVFENNIINSNNSSYHTVANTTSCTFKNNIIIPPYYEFEYNSSNNSYLNNITLNDLLPNGGSSFNNKSVYTFDSIFFNIYTPNYTNVYSQNFRLNSISPGRNFGTDGTDVGIYGTNQPTKTGWVPSNPHISYKSVAQQTDANGNLKATFKVKAQSN